VSLFQARLRPSIRRRAAIAQSGRAPAGPVPITQEGVWPRCCEPDQVKAWPRRSWATPLSCSRVAQVPLASGPFCVDSSPSRSREDTRMLGRARQDVEGCALGRSRPARAGHGSAPSAGLRAGFDGAIRRWRHQNSRSSRRKASTPLPSAHARRRLHHQASHHKPSEADGPGAASDRALPLKGPDAGIRPAVAQWRHAHWRPARSLAEGGDSRAQAARVVGETGKLQCESLLVCRVRGMFGARPAPRLVREKIGGRQLSDACLDLRPMART